MGAIAFVGVGAVASASATAAVGCRGGSNATPPVVTSAKAAEERRAELASGGRGSRLAVRALLDDPRLARVRELERGKDPVGAAAALRDARPADLSAADACAWDHLEGRLLSGGGAIEAVAAFDRASAPGCPLATWSKLRAAQSLARAGHADEAIARARSIPEDVVAVRDDVQMVVAESLAAKGDRAAALPMWRAWLTANPRGSRWVDTSLRIATALVDGVDGPPETRAREAYDLATKVVVEAPKLADSAGASAVRGRAVSLLRGKDAAISEALSEGERARQAQGWLEANEPTRAYELATQVLSAAGEKPGAAACKAAMTRASAAPKVAAKVKSAKGDAWADAVAACEKDDALVQALYSGAKARGGKDPKVAIGWFARLERLFPEHRLADDARLRGALLVAGTSEEGSEARADEMLRSLVDAYPNGDMRTEALFRVALARMKKGDWEGAKPHLERIVELAPDDRHWATAGRAAYFRARAAAATGDAEGARRRLVDVVQRHPLTFYMLLSHARLAAFDPALAKRTLAEAAQRDGDGDAPAPVTPVSTAAARAANAAGAAWTGGETSGEAGAASPVAVILASAELHRAARLLEVGETDAARREVSASGALADGAPPELAWEIGALYNQAGLPELGHLFSRRPHEMFAHYPEGRWRRAWEAAYPRAFHSLVVKACGERSLPTTLAWAIMREESSFVAEAKSHSNAYGLMQLIIPTAKWMAAGTTVAVDEASLKRPEVSIELGVKLLSTLRARHGHPALAIGAYNGGSGAVERWMSARAADELDLFVELVPWEETRNYVKRVLSTQAAYAYLYDPGALAEPLGLPLRLVR